MIVYQTKHFLIDDCGEDWEGRYSARYGCRIKPEFDGVVPPYPYATSNISAESLVETMNEFEKREFP